MQSRCFSSHFHLSCNFRMLQLYQRWNQVTFGDPDYVARFKTSPLDPNDSILTQMTRLILWPAIRRSNLDTSNAVTQSSPDFIWSCCCSINQSILPYVRFCDRCMATSVSRVLTYFNAFIQINTSNTFQYNFSDICTLRVYFFGRGYDTVLCCYYY